MATGCRGRTEPSTSKESEPAGLEPPTPKRYIETVVGAGKRLYVIALAFAFAPEVTGPLALALCLQTLVKASLALRPRGR